MNMRMEASGVFISWETMARMSLRISCKAMRRRKCSPASPAMVPVTTTIPPTAHAEKVICSRAMPSISVVSTLKSCTRQAGSGGGEHRFGQGFARAGLRRAHRRTSSPFSSITRKALCGSSAFEKNVPIASRRCRRVLMRRSGGSPGAGGPPDATQNRFRGLAEKAPADRPGKWRAGITRRRLSTRLAPAARRPDPPVPRAAAGGCVQAGKRPVRCDFQHGIRHLARRELAVSLRRRIRHSAVGICRKIPRRESSSKPPRKSW